MKYKASCHCGSIEFSVDTNLSKIVQCNCSICKRKNAKMALISKDSITIIKGEENLGTYQFNTMKATHFFCKTCGIYTHHNRRSDPNGVGINIGCVEEIDPFEYDVEFVDMKNK